MILQMFYCLPVRRRVEVSFVNIELIPWSNVLPEKVTVKEGNYSTPLESEDSLPCLQEPTSDHYPEPD
jgi:hypothetical protein